MSRRNHRAVIVVVAVAGFVGLLVGWAGGLVGEGPVGRTATTAFVAVSLLAATVLTIVFFNRVREFYGSN